MLLPCMGADYGQCFRHQRLIGIVGMAGGMVLMFILISLLPVSSAMILHAATQLTANGSRALLLQHILWGQYHCISGFSSHRHRDLPCVIPDPAWVLPSSVYCLVRPVEQIPQGLNITKPLTTVACGLLVTFAQLIADNAGPA